MKVDLVNNYSFEGKNTFIKKAKDAADIIERRYYQSLHHEAKSRLAYLKFEKANRELDDMKFDYSIKSFLNLSKKILKIANYKLDSVDQQLSAYKRFPERFWEADDPSANPQRFYNIPKQYTKK